MVKELLLERIGLYKLSLAKYEPSTRSLFAAANTIGVFKGTDMDCFQYVREKER